MDVGNTNIKYAIFDGDKLVMSFRVATEHKKTSDEYGGQLISILGNNDISTGDIKGGIISSVVPQLDYTLERMCNTYLKIKPMLLAPGLKTGMNLRVDNAKEVGADRVVNNVAAVRKYGFPLIIVDFGTATTFNVIDAKGEFIGGVRGLAEYIVKKIKRELKYESVKTVATGGFSEVIAKEINCIDFVDKLLTLEGLKYLYELNISEAKN